MTNNEIRKHIRQFYDLGLLAFPFKLYRDQQSGKKAYSIRNAIGEPFRWQEEKHLVDLAFAESILDKIRCTAIAAYCGAEHNLIVVDIDKKGGKDGFEALTDAGLLIPDNIPSVSTPSGGLHYLFAFPDELRDRQTVWQFDNGIDIQGDNSITLLPPSMYPGGVYDWVTPINGKLPQMPKSLLDWLLENLPRTGERNPSTASQSKTVFDNNESNIATIATVATDIDERSHNDLMTFLPDAIEFLSTKCITYAEWCKIGFALGELGHDLGRDWFVRLTVNNSHFHDTVDDAMRKWSSLWRSRRGGVNLRTLFWVAKQYGYQYPTNAHDYLIHNESNDQNISDSEVNDYQSFQFWQIDDKKNKLSFKFDKFIDFLSTEGFAKIRLSENSDFMFVHLDGKIVDIVEPVDIKDFTTQYVDDLGLDNAAWIQSELINRTKKLFDVKTLEHLPSLNLEFMWDTATESYYYYSNGWISVSSAGHKMHKYSDLPKYVWRRQILPRNFRYVNSTGCEFDRFLHMVTGINNNQAKLERFYSLRSTIGYSLHRFRNPRINKAVVFIDEKITGDPFERNGRTGKSLVVKALGKIRKIASVEGDTYKRKSAHPFALEIIDHTTELIEFDDAMFDFDFDALFTFLTGDLTINRKYERKFQIKHDRAPKMIITSNHVIGGQGGSYDGRMKIIEFCDYFSAEYTPFEEFGHLFFNDWDNDEWNRFDSYMIDIVQDYLDSGFVDYGHINLTERKLIYATCTEFYQFVMGYLLDEVEKRLELQTLDSHVPTDCRFSMGDLYDHYRNWHPDISSQTKFSRYLTRFAQLYGLKKNTGMSYEQYVWFSKGAKRKDAK